MSEAMRTEGRLADQVRDKADGDTDSAQSVGVPAASRWSARLRNAGLPIIGFLVILLFWQLLTSGLVADSTIVTAFQPRNAFRELIGFFVSGVIYSHILASLERIGLGLALAVAIGVPIGIVIGHYRTAERASSLAFQFLRMISPLSWMPIAIIAFGVGNNPVIFLIAIAAVWPMIINTAHGVSSLDQRWIRAARTLGANEWKLVRMVILPAVVPDMLTGLRLAVGSGLGYSGARGNVGCFRRPRLLHSGYARPVQLRRTHGRHSHYRRDRLRVGPAHSPAPRARLLGPRGTLSAWPEWMFEGCAEERGTSPRATKKE